MLIRVFLHVEFISAMKTVQNPTIFVKNAKKKKKKKKCFLDGKEDKWLVLVISVNFLKFYKNMLISFHRNSWAECQKKVIKMFFRWKRRQIKKN